MGKASESGSRGLDALIQVVSHHARRNAELLNDLHESGAIDFIQSYKSSY
jgi:hypothetical protein